MPRYDENQIIPGVAGDCLRLLAISPFEKPDLNLCRAWIKNGAAAAVDIGRDPGCWPDLLQRISRDRSGMLGIRVPDSVDFRPDQVPANVAFLVLTADRDFSQWQQYPILAQVNSQAEAKASLERGAVGLIAKGSESSGKVGEESTFILIQRLLSDEQFVDTPIWAQGGIGFHTAPAVLAGGAFGVVLDSQLALLPESKLDVTLKARITKFEGPESRLIGGYAISASGSTIDQDPVLESLTQESVSEALAGDQVLAMGQDTALANHLAQSGSSCEGLIHQLKTSITGHVHQAKSLSSLSSQSPLAKLHGTRYPIAQGPMTRVSDTAEFAKAVSDNGGLPFLALSLMKPQACETLLRNTETLLGEKSWGVGVLGFAPPEVLQPQLELIQQFKPRVVLVAGGRPSQARALEEQGILAYLHVPAPGLLDMFLKDGARSFVFEGRECGGHIGPRFSFVLWEQQIQRLLQFDRPEELNILFAGGIHDERSAAMVAAAAAALCARGARIGVLMGSAYIATEEAVATGAVNDVFQNQVISGGETVLLETAPGHAIRGLDTEFAEFFNREKQRLVDEGLDKKAVWQKLEDLNLGRLRLATKGIERVGDELVARDEAIQKQSGMYMIGQLAAMRNRVCRMSELHHAVTDGANRWLQASPTPKFEPASRPEPIAIVGMDCIYPGSSDLESYWANILSGKDFVREVSPERWNSELYYNTADKESTPSKWGGFIDDFPFDPLQFGIPPQSLAAIEPAQLLGLEVSRRALLDAGYAPDLEDLEREKTSVIFGAESGTDLSGGYTFRNTYKQYFGELPSELDEVLPSLTEDSFPGVLANVIAGRIANRLDLGGVNYTVDAACASSLTAVELAVKELRSGSSDVVLAGGADFHNGINDFLMFASVTALSATGRCRSFDNDADGIALGEGVGVVVLKRLSDAERDGDRIYAVIDGIAGSSDGKSLGLTAPRKEGQKRALDRAYRQAGILPGEVGLVEAHGTGTVVGDRTELATLTEIYSQGGALNQQTVLGSVKTQIGHTKCAAGMAGLIKISKSLYHRVLPSTQNIKNPNAYYRPQNSPFTLDSQPRPWIVETPRAALSAFGFGGTNFHAVLSAYKPAADQQTQRDCPPEATAQWPAELFVFTGQSFDEARGEIARLIDYLDTDVPHALRDLSYSLWQSRKGDVQCALVAEDKEQLLQLLHKAQSRQADSAVFYRDAEAAETNTGKLAFLFPGQGSQSPGMLRDIFLAFPQLRSVLEAGRTWLPKLYPPTAYDADARRAQQAAITDTRVAQPTLGMVDTAMAMVLRGLGVKADMMAGHSYGELVALAQAGCFGVEELLALSEARGESILSAAGEDPGRMAAVSADREVLSRVLAPIDDVVLANQNSPRQTVISGPSEAIENALHLLKEANISARPIEVACAFHSPLVANAEKLFAVYLDSVGMKAPNADVYSNLTAAVYGSSVEAVKRQLASHIVNPVRFVEQIEAMYENGARVFVEVGPGRTLSGMVDAILNGKPHRMVVTDRKGESSLKCLLEAVGRLMCDGRELSLDYLFSGRKVTQLDLSAPVELSKTTWWVNGARARPNLGELPAHAGREITQPLPISAGAAPVQPMADVLSGEGQVVAQYLNNVREMVHAQRDVMLGLFGGQSVSSPVATIPVQGERENVLPLQDAAQQGVPVSAVVPASDQVAAVDVQQSLVAIVSDRTGYPAEMLDLDLDLEADLSIDSIKRLEIIGSLIDQLRIKETLSADADALMEQLATQKTLREMINWLQEQLPVADSVSQTTGAEISATPDEAPPAQDVESVLLGIVSDRTGYPTDALDLDLDLEADLSIDSIKRLEIVGELSSKLQLDDLVADKDAAMETLASLKTLREMTAWLNSQSGNVAQDTQQDSPVAEPDDSNQADPQAVELSRYVIKVTQTDEAVKGELAFEGKRFVITDDELGVASQLKQLLEAQSATVEVIDFSEQAFERGENPFNIDALGAVDGLIHLASLNPSHRVRDVKRFFNLVRECLTREMSYLLVATGLGGSFGCYDEDGETEHRDFGHGSGMAGMVKSIAKEFPNVRSHWVDLDINESAEELAAYLQLELLAENPLTEVGYQSGIRRGVEVVKAALSDVSGSNNLDLNKDSVVLVTGGAQGITAKVAVELANQFGCQLELVGRSPFPDEEEPAELAQAEDLIALRKLVIQREKNLTPSEVERFCSRILSARAIRKTLDDIKAAGGRVNYHSLDVRDIDAFGNLIEGLYDKYGRIDGVIHGAGVVEDKLLRHKTSDSFERVFDTKVRGALMLSKLIREDVKFVVFFSSVAGAFGNRGQVDYATANDALDKIAHSMQARLKGRVLSVNWGPWAEMGMVSAELEREYLRKGIGLIPVAEGVDALIKELKHGNREDAQVVLMCASAESMR